MSGGFYRYREKTRKGVRPERDFRLELSRLNDLAKRLIPVRMKADGGDIGSMQEANELIVEMSGIRSGLRDIGCRTRYDSSNQEFVEI